MLQFLVGLTLIFSLLSIQATAEVNPKAEAKEEQAAGDKSKSEKTPDKTGEEFRTGVEKKIADISTAIEQIKKDIEAIQKKNVSTEVKVDAIGTYRFMLVTIGSVVLSLLLILVIRHFARPKYDYLSENKLMQRMPVITKIEPMEGTVSGGQRTKIRVRNYSEIKQVLIGDRQAAIGNIEHDDDERVITASTPPAINNAAGLAHVMIETASGWDVYGKQFEYVWPALELQACKSGLSGGWQEIKGKGFGPDTKVQIDGNECRAAFINEATMLAVFPSRPTPATIKFQIVREDGKSLAADCIYA